MKKIILIKGVGLFFLLMCTQYAGIDTPKLVQARSDMSGAAGNSNSGDLSRDDLQTCYCSATVIYSPEIVFT